MHSLTKFLLALSFWPMGLSPDSIARHLRSLIGGDVEFDPVSRRLYSTDAGLCQIQPLGVVSPRDTDDVVRLVAYATEQGLSLVPRGMGSGLNGGAVGEGIQVDFTRYMHSVLEIAPDASWVRVQPGLVMATLNQGLRDRGVFFPPDPSSGNHCSLGGMIGTNASGARSVAYGATKDHVLALEVVMADATPRHIAPAESDDHHAPTLWSDDAFANAAFSGLLQDLATNRDVIDSRVPRVKKNSCGYRIEALLDHSPVPLQKLFVGAEGTLGLVTEATLQLAPLPSSTGIAMAYFSSLSAAGEAVPAILGLSPTAVEIMDSRFLALVRRYEPRVDAMLPRDADTALLIEFEGSNQDHLGERFAELANCLGSSPSPNLVRAESQEDADFLWQVRRAAVALMQRAPGRRQPLPFIEDIAVPPERLPECIQHLQRLFDHEGVQAVAVGHVGDGNLHVRPMLDVRDPADRLILQRLYEEVTGYVIGVGGTLSGEHGDGLVHTGRLQEIYGPQVYELFVRVKQAFDPQGIFNPGKKVGPQGEGGPLVRPRYGSDYSTLPQSPLLNFPPRGYETEAERCHGCGACKSTVATTMCPTYRATHREHASPRAKANLLRAIISGVLDTTEAYESHVTKQVLSYCIGCGMCAVECPSGVNIPKLVLEAKSRYRTRHKASPLELALGHAETVARAASRAAPLVNRALAMYPVKRAAEILVGLDSRRPLGPFAPRSFRSTALLAQVAANTETAGTGPLVAYFCDIFADYYDPALAQCVVDALRAHGARVGLPEQGASGIPEMLYGFASRARTVAARNVRGVLPNVRQGAQLISAEPTATYAFKVHYPDYLSDPDCHLVADAACDLCEFLLRLRKERPDMAPEPARADRAALERMVGSPLPSKRPLRVGYHRPCHLKALDIGEPALELLSQSPDLDVVALSAGCCGMAGTFGMKRSTYDLSIAAGRPLFERVGEVQPDLLASECSTCRMQLAHVTGLSAVHPIELLALAYGLRPLPPAPEPQTSQHDT